MHAGKQAHNLWQTDWLTAYRQILRRLLLKPGIWHGTIQKPDFFCICNINQCKSKFLKSKIKSKSQQYKLHLSSMLFAVMTKFKEHLLKTWFSDPFSMLFHYELLCELLQLQFQSQTKIPCYSLWNLCFSNILLWQPKDKLTKQTKVNMKVTFPVMSYVSSSGKKARKKNSGLYGIFFFFQAHYCKDFFHIHVFIHSSNIWLLCIHSHLKQTKLKR